MTKWSELFSEQELISRLWYFAEGLHALEAPVGSAIVRVSMVGAGGWKVGGSTTAGAVGHGAAFARYKGSCTPGEDFTIQVGDAQKTKQSFNVNGDANGDSIFTRDTGSVVLCKADRGRSSQAGLASNSVGDTKRDGSANGDSGGDDEDAISLGFGGKAARALEVRTTGSLLHVAAGPGGGGLESYAAYVGTEGGGGYTVLNHAKAGSGLVCVEFFKTDPGY